MANSTAVSVQFKLDCMNQFLANTISTLKAALYQASATTNGSNTAYTATGEVSGGSYSAGGVAVTNGTSPSSTGTTAFWTPSASIAFTGLSSATTDCIMIYDTARANKAIGTWTFSSQTVTGTLTLTMPTNGASTGLLRL